MQSSKIDIRSLVRRMTLDQKVGQCLTFGFAGSIVTDDFLECFEQFHFGGLRLSPYSHNFEYKVKTAKMFASERAPDYAPSKDKQLPIAIAPYLTPPQYAGLLDRFQALARKHNAGIPLHVSVDQEGDMSADIVKGGVALFPSQMGMAATGDPVLVERAAYAIGRQLRNYGVNMTHAPVLDVNNLPDNIETDTRSYSNDPRKCARFGTAMMRGYQRAGVIATGKHFPGRGRSNLDAHDDLPVIEGSLKSFERIDLVPFQALVNNGLDAVMTAHTIYPGLDPSGLIATVSPTIVTELLRGKMGFKGVITTDSITMAALIEKYGAAEGAALAIQAGSDLVLMKEETRLRGEMFYTIRKFVRDGRIPEEQLGESVARIIALKARRGLFGAQPCAPRAAKAFPDQGACRLARSVALKSMIVARNRDRLVPLKKGARVYLIEQLFFDRSPNDLWNHPRLLFETFLQKGIRVRYRSEINYADAKMGGVDTTHDIKHILQSLERPDYDLVIVMSVFYRNYLTDPALTRQIVMASPKPVLVVTNTPYASGFVPEARNAIVNFSTNPAGFKALADVLTGRAGAEGRLPVSRKLTALRRSKNSGK